MISTKPHLLMALGWILLPLMMPKVLANSYPDRSIKFVLAAPAGSPPDVLTRALGQEITRLTKQPVVVDNRPGANMQLAAQAVANAAPDGYTVLIAGNAAFTINQHLFKELSYDPARSFEPVSTVAQGAWLWAVNPHNVTATTVQELLDQAKNRDTELTVAESSPVTQVLSKMIQKQANVEFLQVPYRTGTQALPDLISGRVDMVFIDTSVMKYADAGQVRVLGWTGSERLPALASVPTLEESGLPDTSVTYWIGAYTPAGTAPAINERLSQLIAQASQAASVQAAHELGGTVVDVMRPADLAKRQQTESQLWAQRIELAGIEQQ